MASTTTTILSTSSTVRLATSPTTALVLTNVLYEKKGAVAYVTVNRPKVLNALNTPTWTDLRAAFEDARDDTAIRGVVLTGAGNKAFIAGADITELAHLTAFEAEQSSRFGQDVLDLIENLGKPVIAAVNGFALGGDMLEKRRIRYFAGGNFEGGNIEARQEIDAMFIKGGGKK